MGILDLVQHLSDILPVGSVTTADSADYGARRLVWNGMINRHPAAIVCPNTTDMVANVVRLAAASGAPLSLRGGGHSFPGFSTCDGGIVLDLGRLNQITIDPISRIADVGGGALLGDLDRASEPHGLVVPAGVVSHTGAGGLTLGGGMGWTSRRFGMTVDNLIGVELVMADGRIVDANQDSDPELFWGIRGGGGNFGVVTRFRYRMHPLGPVTVGTWTYPSERRAETLLAFGVAAASAPRSVTMSFGSRPGGLSVTAFHSGPNEDGEALVSGCGHLAGPGEGGIAHPRFVDHQSRGDDGVRWGRRYYGRGGFIGTIDKGIAQTVAESAETAPTPDSEVYVIQLGGAISDVPEGATAYSGRSAGFYWLAQPIWDDPADDARCLAWGRKYGAALAAVSQAGNYVNEQGETGRDTVMQAYGRSKYERLARLKAHVDPQNLFRLNQNIVPAP